MSRQTSADPFSPAERSRVMRAVKGRDTGPEMIVRRLSHGLGARHRLGGAGLPGRPDLTYPGRRAVVFVHGCFWHGHDCRRGARAPKANSAYWGAKIARNRDRDGANLEKLAQRGWRSLVIWECELRDRDEVRARLAAFLGVA